MAKEENAAAAAPKKKKLMVIIIAAVLVLVAAGGGAFFMLKGSADEGDEDEVVVEKHKGSKKKPAKEAAAAPTYVQIESFTVNLLADSGGDQFMQLGFSVEVEDASVGERIKSFSPKIRNGVTLLLSGKKSSELLQREGKEKLAADIRNLFNDVLEPGRKNKDSGPVSEVLFTSFIIQ